MNTVIARLKSAAARRAAYYRTIQELEAMPLDVALDLDIHREDARRIARSAVYGG
jgi:uncharacterized protein YjiS (DUF1127 family)